jgi:hypothetical protein
MRLRGRIITVVVAIIVGAGLVLIGRMSVDVRSERATAYSQGLADGLRDGQAEGLRTGRALQAGSTLPPQVRDLATAAFDDGYVAGWNDAFGGFDGGWQTGVPYLVTLAPGNDGLAYRISSRTPTQP